MNILMINQDQFGYKAGYYHYCKHLTAQGHKVVVVCRDQKLNRLELPGVEVFYVYEQDSIKWRFKCADQIRQLVGLGCYDVALCSYFRGCFLLRKSFGHVPVIIDIRSGDLSKNKITRWIFNRFIVLESSMFSRRMILAQSLAEMLGLKKNSYDVVPLGADIISRVEKDYSRMNLLYVGTLFQRNIQETIYGISMFRKEYPEVDIRYDIVGFGTAEEEALLENSILECGLSDSVVFHGRVNYEALSPFYDRANIGIAYVPMTPYYDCQPATKIYEYVLSGMYCIATRTYENRILVTEQNGILCEDNSVSFYNALKEYYMKDKESISTAGIRESMMHHKWSRVVNDILIENMKVLIKK